MGERIRHWLGMEKHDPYVREYIEKINMKASICMSIFVIMVECGMLLMVARIVFFDRGGRSTEWIVTHLQLYLLLLGASMLMLMFAVSFLRGKRAGRPVMILWKATYTFVCVCFGMYVSYVDYLKGEQILSFLTMLLFVGCFLVWRPVSAILILSGSFGLFYFICDSQLPATLATKVNLFTTWMAAVMIAVGNYHQRLSEAKKDKGLEEISTHDELTGIHNMHFFRERAEKLLGEAHASGKALTLIYFDIVGFKAFNERYGFSSGNELLWKLAGAIISEFQGSEAARLSDDHFVVLTKEEPQQRCRNLQKVLEGLRGEVFLSLKCGIYRTDGFHRKDERQEDINLLCDRARFAAGSIKNQPDVLYCIYDEKLHEGQRRKRYILSHLDEALEKQYIRVYYQPIMEAKSGKICAIEALARWMDPVYGLLSPAEFIGTLEEFGLIHKLDQYMITKACEDYRSAVKEGRPLIPVSINLSRLDFELCKIAQFVMDTAAKYQVPKEYLDLEITESALTDSSGGLKEAMNDLRDSGYRIWLDDFGSGYSTFNVLKDYTFDVLKIDMRFLEDLGRKGKPAVIIRSILDLCGQLNLVALSEGVETQEEYEFLKEAGCDLVQGYLFSKPVEREELDRLIREKGWQTVK